MQSISSKLIVGFVWFLIIGLATSFIFLFMPQLLEHNIITFSILVLLLGITLPLLVISYGKSTCVSPGNPSLDLKKQDGEMNLERIIYETKCRSQRKKQLKKMKKNRQNRQAILEEEIELRKQTQYCFKCDNIKPIRTHHCSTCKQCILRMDHHCPWVGTCVGLHNHKYFILFLFYATIGLLIVTLAIAIDFFNGQKILQKLTETKRYVMYFVGFAALCLCLSIGFLLVTQLIASFQNLTTLDTFVDGLEQKNPWDTGSIYDNLAEIFGRGGWWLLPTKPNLYNYEEDENYYESL